jgi:hypothetical protein
MSAYTSKVSIPTEPMTGDKSYSGEPPIIFRPDFWMVSFRYHPFREPRYYLGGTRLKKDGTPTIRASRARKTVTSADVPAEVIDDVREQIRKEANEAVAEAGEMLAMLDRDRS